MEIGLESRTLLLVTGAVYVLLPIGVWIALRRPREWPPLLWCVGGVIGGIGLLLIGMRGHLPDLLSYALGQPLLALGAVLVGQSLRMDLKRPLPWILIALAATIYALSLAWMVGRVDAQVLGVFIRLANLAAQALLIHAAWRVGRHENSRCARMIAAAYGVQMLATIANMVSAWLGSDEIHTLAPKPLSLSAYAVTLGVALVASMAYLGLALERSLRRQLALVGETTRALQVEAQRQAIIELDRERLLSVLSESLVQALRQPLTEAQARVQTALRLLRTRPRNSSLLQESLTKVSGELRHSGGTIARIREFLRPVASTDTQIDLSRVLLDVYKMLQQEAINRGTRLRLHQRRGPLWVNGDALQLTQAVMQLVRNALDAVRDQTQRKIDIVLELDQKEVRVAVHDTGPGFAPAQLLLPIDGADAFPRHLQGIGLLVVRSVAQQHGGRLLLQNQMGAGARATLILPRDPRPHATSPNVARSTADGSAAGQPATCTAVPSGTGGGDRR